MDNQTTKPKLIKKIFWHSVYDLNIVETFLEEMAADGYMFVKCSGHVFYFKKCEPVQLKFFVDVFYKNSNAMDVIPINMLNEYMAYCEECGWHHIFNDGKTLFFYTINPDATPIQTDNELRLKLINKLTLKNECMLWFFLPFMFIFNSINFLNWNNLAETLIENFHMVFMFLVMMPLIVLPQIIRYLYFYIKNRYRVAHNKDLFFYSAKGTKIFHGIHTFIMTGLVIALAFLLNNSNIVAGIILLGIVVSMFIAAFVYEHYRQKSGISKSNNIAFILNTGKNIALVALLFMVAIYIIDGFNLFNSIIVSVSDTADHSYTTIIMGKDDIPFTLDTLNVLPKDAKYHDTQAYLNSSLFGSYNSYGESIFNDNHKIVGEVNYDIVESDFDFIIESYVKNYSTKNAETLSDITDKEAELWNAKNVFINDVSHFGSSITSVRLVVYEDKVILISSDVLDFNSEQVKAITEILCK